MKCCSSVDNAKVYNYNAKIIPLAETGVGKKKCGVISAVKRAFWEVFEVYSAIITGPLIGCDKKLQITVCEIFRADYAIRKANYAINNVNCAIFF